MVKDVWSHTHEHLRMAAQRRDDEYVLQVFVDASVWAGVDEEETAEGGDGVVL